MDKERCIMLYPDYGYQIFIEIKHFTEAAELRGKSPVGFVSFNCCHYHQFPDFLKQIPGKISVLLKLLH